MKPSNNLYLFLFIWILAACGSPQAAQPTAVPAAAQPTAQPTAAPSATQPAPPSATAIAASPPPTAVPINVPPSTTVAQTPTDSASGATAIPPTPVAADRVLALQEPRLRGEDVRAVQQRLLDLGYTEAGAVDSVFGPQTEAAVRAFQQTNRLQVDGAVGPLTRARLFGSDATGAVVPIVVHTSSSYLLGGAQTGVWLDAPAAAPLLAGGERYRVLADQAAETTASGNRPEQTDPICEAYFVDLEPPISGDAAVAVGGHWVLQPRTPRTLAESDSSLQQAVATFLQSKGIAQPDVQITRVAQIDLDGDGSDEVVVTATRLAAQDPTDAAAGDYSVVAVQTTINGAPTMIELAGNYFPQAGDFVAPNDYRFLSILDLNGDGAMEVVVNGAYYEGAFTSAYQIEGTTARTLLTTGCGV
jgi:galactitol-specific phosphotransferase system IIB component